MLRIAREPETPYRVGLVMGDVFRLQVDLADQQVSEEFALTQSPFGYS